jgi:hypothetical protein
MSQTEYAKRLPKTLAGEPWHGPAKYHVFVEVPATPAPGPVLGQVDKYVGRVGTTNDLTKIPGMILADLNAMGDTLGGLIAPTSTKGRTYRVFEMNPVELDATGFMKQARQRGR